MSSFSVKNRTPAPIQVTAEQLMLEARDRAAQAQPPAPRRHVADAAELAAHRLRVRKEFEDRLRMSRANVAVWLRYAKWEGAQGELDRARSVFERALDVAPRDAHVWTRYAELETRARFVNRARNVWDRAVALLPRVDALWLKYTYLEEVLGNADGARALFERWMAWAPEEQAWLAYARFEERQARPPGAAGRARGVYERLLACRPSLANFLRLAKWEERANGQRALARRALERAAVELDAAELDDSYFAHFAAFEARCGEDARARTVLEFGLAQLADPGQRARLQTALATLQRQRGDRAGVEDVVLAKRREAYEEAVSTSPLNFDAWLDLAKLEEAVAVGEDAASKSAPHYDGVKDESSDDNFRLRPNLRNSERIREVYERAIAAVPPSSHKHLWRRYVYLWLRYACYEELVARDASRARTVYAAALAVVPHKSFTFGKLWLQSALLEVRCEDLAAARRMLGRSLGFCPKEKVIRGYIALELALGEVDRCRALHEKHIALAPSSAQAWTRFAELERSLGEDERARAVLALALQQPALDLPELAWKAAIDLEAELGDLARARELYQQLLSRTQHVSTRLLSSCGVMRILTYLPPFNILRRLKFGSLLPRSRPRNPAATTPRAQCTSKDMPRSRRRAATRASTGRCSSTRGAFLRSHGWWNHASSSLVWRTEFNRGSEVEGLMMMLLAPRRAWPR